MNIFKPGGGTEMKLKGRSRGHIYSSLPLCGNAAVSSQATPHWAVFVSIFLKVFFSTAVYS